MPGSFARRFLALWISLVCSGAGGATNSLAPGFTVRRWSAEDGLPQNSIKALAQTRDGYLWIGTLYGLARFDGVQFKIFDHGNTPEMTHDSINALVVDEKDGSLWVGTGDGLLHYRDYRFQRYQPQPGAYRTIGHIWPSQAGGVWTKVNPGEIARVRDGEFRTWKLGERRIEDDVLQITEMDESRLLIWINGELEQFDCETGSRAKAGPVNEKMSFFCLLRESNGALWLSTDHGIWRKESDHWSHLLQIDPKIGPGVYSLQHTSDGTLWASMLDGDRLVLHRWIDGRLERFTAVSFPDDFNLTRLLEDREGTLWVGSALGLFQLRPQRLRVISTADGLRNHNTSLVTETPDGTIWIGTGDGVSTVKDGAVANLPLLAPRYRTQGIGAFLADRQSRLWMTHESDCWRFESGAWTNVSLQFPFSADLGIRFYFEDREDQLWLGAHEGVVRVRSDGNRRYSLAEGLSHRDVRYIHQDRRGDLWFGTYGGGLNRLKEGRITSYATALGDYNNRAWHIHEDSDGVFWVASQNGLNRFVPPGIEFGVPALAGGTVEAVTAGIRVESPPAKAGTPNANSDRFFTFSTEHGLREKVINNVQEDAFGYLWLSGLRGIYRVARRELNDVAAGRRERAEVLAYGEADGMLTGECNGGDLQPSGCRDREGRIWFPTGRGVVVIDPKKVQRNAVPPPVVIEQVRADGEIVFGDDVAADVRRLNEMRNAERGARNERQSLVTSAATRLGPGRARVLEIRYTANSFAAPEKVRFRYRLEDRDPDWIEADSSERRAFYTDLRPGQYTFRVKACNNHGLWNEDGAAFAFSLAPRFTQTKAFAAFVTVGLLAVALGLHRLRLNHQHRIQALEHQLAFERERARIAQDIHDDIGASLTRIQLLGQVVEEEIGKGPKVPEAQMHAQNIAATAREVAQRMDEIVWAVNPRHDTLASFIDYICHAAQEILQPSSIRCRLEVPDKVPELRLASETRHHLYLLVKEGLHNTLKHSGASEVLLRVRLVDGKLQMAIEDNGRGFDPAQQSKNGNGLRNMKERAERLGGVCRIESVAGTATKVTFAIPLA